MKQIGLKIASNTTFYFNGPIRLIRGADVAIYDLATLKQGEITSLYSAILAKVVECVEGLDNILEVVEQKIGEISDTTSADTTAPVAPTVEDTATPEGLVVVSGTTANETEEGELDSKPIQKKPVASKKTAK